MKKILFAITILVIGLTLNASPIAYGLDSSFTIDDLFVKGFSLKSEDETILVTPPKSQIKTEDKAIDQFMLICPDGFDNWILATLMFKSNTSYGNVYSFVSRNYGEGLSKENAEFFAEHYSSDMSEDVLLAKMLSGDLSNYLMKAMVAEMLNEIIEDENIKNMNMWITDDLYIFTVDSSNTEGPTAIFFRTDLMKDYVDTIMGLAFASMF